MKNLNFFYYLIHIILLVTIAYLIYLLFISPPSNQDVVVKVVQCFSFVIAGYGVFYGIYFNISQKYENKEFKKKEEAFKLILQWDNSIILKARDFSRTLKYDKPNISDNELIEFIKSDNEKASAISVLYNYAENIKVAVKYNIADKEIIGQVSEVISNILQRFDAYIQTIIVDRPDEKKSLKETYIILNECKKARADSLSKI